jgi:hypothetical protein
VAITSDSRYRREKIPPSLQQLADGLAEHFDVPSNHIGIRGDANHRGGYHRSRNFLTSSPYARDRKYSVTDAKSNRDGDGDWVSALDISLPKDKLIALCRRLDKAVREGKLEKVAEWYGNDDGDNKVDGFDNLRNKVAAADPSHLWHAHIGLLRGRAGDDHSDLLAVLTGEDEEEDDVDQKTGDAILGELQSVKDELKALNDFLMTGRRYGKSATKPPESTQIGLLHSELQQIVNNTTTTSRP